MIFSAGELVSSKLGQYLAAHRPVSRQEGKSSNPRPFLHDARSHTCMNTFPITTSSSSLNTVLNTTVTRSFFASTYLQEGEKGEHGCEQSCWSYHQMRRQLHDELR